MLPTPERTPRRIIAAVLALLVLGTGLRLYRVEVQAPWIDEVARLIWAKGYEFDRPYGFLPSEIWSGRPARPLLRALPVVDRHNPPLNSIVLNTALRWFGDSDLVARLPSVLFGGASILGAWLAGAAVAGPAVGLAAAALVAVSPCHVYYAQEINHYALAACLVAFSFWFYFRWLQRGRRWDGVGLALTGACAVYTHYFAAIALLVQAAGLLTVERRERLLRALSPYLIAAAGFVPYLPTARRQLREMTDPGQIAFFHGWSYFVSAVQAVFAQPWLGDYGLLLSRGPGMVLLTATVVLCAVGLRAEPDRRLRRVLLVNAAGPLVLVCVLYWATRWNSILWPRYQLFFTFVPFLVIALALRRRWVRWVAIPAMAGLMGYGLHYQYFELVKEPWTAAASAIARVAAPQEPVLVHLGMAVYGLARYLPAEHRLFGIDATADWPERVALATEGQPAAWAVTAYATVPGFPAALDALLACRFARRERVPVEAGRIALVLTRYSEPHADPARLLDARSGEGDCRVPDVGAYASSNRGWERPAPGPEVEHGAIEAPAATEAPRTDATVTVSGWLFSTRGVHEVVFAVDGKVVLRREHPGLLREDVQARHPDGGMHALFSGYWAALDVDGLEPGNHTLVVTGIRADGTATRVASTSSFVVGRRARRTGVATDARAP